MPKEDTQFKTGNKAAKGHGRPPIPQEIKEIRLMKKKELVLTFSK